jgi:hypothetical protein
LVIKINYEILATYVPPNYRIMKRCGIRGGLGWAFPLCFQRVVSWVGWDGGGWFSFSFFPPFQRWVGRVFKGRGFGVFFNFPKGFFLGWHGEWGGLVFFKRREGKGQGLPKYAKLSRK